MVILYFIGASMARGRGVMAGEAECDLGYRDSVAWCHSVLDLQISHCGET